MKLRTEKARIIDVAMTIEVIHDIKLVLNGLKSGFQFVNFSSFAGILV